MANLSEKEWSRVVCFFTSGEKHQLTDWPPVGVKLNNDDRTSHEKVVNIFHRVKGFFLHYQDVVPPPEVKKWNVSRLIVQRNKRHTDINVKDQIWKELEAFLKKERFKEAHF